jgi:peroxiredoxin
MARTNSTMLPLGTVAPDFALPDVTSGKIVSLADFKKSSALLVVFLCNHCPYVKHIQAGLTQLAKDLQARGVGVVGISSNDVANYPDDGPEKMREEAQRAGYTFPYLYDESQSVALAYRAACTPDFFLFDGAQKLVYRGQMDDARRANNLPVTGSSLRAAVDAVLAGQAVSPNQIPSLGCNIKWRPENEPDYFKLL